MIASSSCSQQRVTRARPIPNLWNRKLLNFRRNERLKSKMSGSKKLKGSKPSTLGATANKRDARSRILLRVYAELFHSREESCAVHS